MSSAVRVFAGTCPDESCRRRLVFSSNDTLAECLYCGQRHHTSAIHDAAEIKDQAMAVQTVVRSLLTATHPNLKRGVETVKVLGLSNYHCKLLSPLLTHFGMDKETFKAKPLPEINSKATFDCGALSDRSFRIDPQHLEVPGYGRDTSGSATYLAGTLARINGNRETLVPIHADGDGHCLVHAVSRALVGRELFWHPLRTNLKQHFLLNIDKYKVLFRDFIHASEWRGIIEECDPEYEPLEDDGEILGLRNIHVFGLANVLKRPVILLDSVAGMKSSGDYSAVFLPALVSSEECRSKSGELNKPLCLAWSSSAHNHYIPLVGIKGENLPLIPRGLLPKVWAVPQSLLTAYIEFDTWDCLTVGGDRGLQDSYIRKLTEAMNELFQQKFGVHPSLVSDVHQYNYRKPSVVTIKPMLVVQTTQKAAHERRLFRCLTCDACCIAPLATEWLRPGNNGLLYNMAVKRFGQLSAGKIYSFNAYGVSCSYDAKKDVLVLDKNQPALDSCSVCHDNKLRLLLPDGTVLYENGDPTKTPTATLNGRCRCGYKHWWAGQEYDNLPEMVPVILKWGDRVVTETVPWFQYESDPPLNSNAFQVASYLVQKHFPGEFGSEHLIQSVVNQILETTKLLQVMQTVEDKLKKDRAQKMEGKSRLDKCLGSPGSPEDDLSISPQGKLCAVKPAPISQAWKLGATPRGKSASQSDATSFSRLCPELQKVETVNPQKIEPTSSSALSPTGSVEASVSSQPEKEQSLPACSPESERICISDSSKVNDVPSSVVTDDCERLSSEPSAQEQQHSDPVSLQPSGELCPTAPHESESHKEETDRVSEEASVTKLSSEKLQEHASSKDCHLEIPKQTNTTLQEIPNLKTSTEEKNIICSEENGHTKDKAAESPVAIQRESKKMAAMCQRSPLPWAVVTVKPCTGSQATSVRVGPGYSILQTEAEDGAEKPRTLDGLLQGTSRTPSHDPSN